MKYLILIIVGILAIWIGRKLATRKMENRNRKLVASYVETPADNNALAEFNEVKIITKEKTDEK